MSLVLKMLLTKLFPQKVVISLAIKVLEWLATKSSNKLDDVLVAELKKALSNG